MTLGSLLLFSSTAIAVTTSISVSTPTGVFNSDGGRDYFGIVANGGTTLNSGDFDEGNALLSAPVGALTGRDQDGGSDGFPNPATASWLLQLPGNAAIGTGLTNIVFDATVAATEGEWHANDTGGANINPDFIIFELYLNGALTASSAYYSTGSGTTTGTLGLDTNNDQVGDQEFLTPSGIDITDIISAGGASINSVELRATYAADGGDTEHWTLGTLSADYELVPEPSTTTLMGLGSLCLLLRRKR
ncbi:PEP-CTERM sorting domain-containing protein [Rubritalea tangerina]|uniref:PEP-CTERM sorting domain-containing protein n=2 Tax=Rubritalea tangerina TaxID=430798 RepID=A0ABW4ZFP6_9BACT